MRRALVRALFAAALCLLGAGTGRADELDIAVGKAVFDRPWVPAPSSTRGNDGLGPLFDARSCSACHPKDGRGTARLGADGAPLGHGLVVALARTGGAPDPVYGARLQTEAVQGLDAEAIVRIREGRDDAGRVTRMPVLSALAYGPLAPDTVPRLRVAPDLRGRGLLERVPQAAILALEDPDDRDGDSVRGRAHRVIGADGRETLGRFGWKAAQPTLSGQIAEAFHLDLGLSTPLLPEPWGDCTPAQPLCRAAPHGVTREGESEISPALFNALVAYVADLPVPGARADAAGARLFAATGCAACHRPNLPLESGGTAALFTDVLLHDLGPGLDDGLDTPAAAGRAWRTAPLAGLSQALARGTGLLHDGRAADVKAALAWHGGEASSALARYGKLPAHDREALIRYVSGL
ncbi:di-heme oxidoredictase family protein [Roseixanthobacter pseudopolyaromaticivorans]|uniref:di-heme oxidoredictase family protein n=1 Tax=Xanthobacteraceae TaxID=335928 RepID=UPI0037278C49